MARRKSKVSAEGADASTAVADAPSSSEPTTEKVQLDGYHDEELAKEAPAEVTTPAPDPFPNGNRLAERRVLRVKAVVQVREDDGNTFKEIIEITTVSKNGAALLLSRPCPVGRLVSLALQMPPELRVYDYYQDIYAMLGVVQNCSPITVNDKTVFQVGVAFIGKKMPDSFKADPTQTYRIVGMSSLGLWSVKEAKRSFVDRKSTRFWRSFEIGISIRDEKTRSTKRQSAITRDVSLGGLSAWGPIEAAVGDRVKLSSKEHDFFAMAVVRNRTENEDPSKSIVHFQFEGAQFPVARIKDEEVAETAPLTEVVEQAR